VARASLFTDKKITFQGSVWILLASSTWCGDTCCQQISNDANKLFFFLFHSFLFVPQFQHLPFQNLNLVFQLIIYSYMIHVLLNIICFILYNLSRLEFLFNFIPFIFILSQAWSPVFLLILFYFL
jgi:hypothetical protein